MKLKAFTLVEMLVVLMTTTLVVSLLVLLYQFLSREYHAIIASETGRGDVLSLYVLLQGDAWRADTLYLAPPGIVVAGKDTVFYRVDTTTVSRERADLADTLSVVTRDIARDAGYLRVSVQGNTGEVIEIMVERGITTSW
jgi:hypothetical protein